MHIMYSFHVHVCTCRYPSLPLNPLIGSVIQSFDVYCTYAYMYCMTSTDNFIILYCLHVMINSSVMFSCCYKQVPGRLYPIDLQYNPIGNQQLSMSMGQVINVQCNRQLYYMFNFFLQKSQKLDPKPYLRIMQQIDSNVALYSSTKSIVI